MSRFFIDFLYKLAILTIIVILIAVLTFKFLFEKYYLGIFPFVLLFFVATTIIVHYRLVRANRYGPGKFTRAFLTYTGVKMLLNLIFILVYVLVDKVNAIPFVVGFLILYIIFTVFEIVTILKHLRKSKI